MSSREYFPRNNAPEISPQKARPFYLSEAVDIQSLQNAKVRFYLTRFELHVYTHNLLCWCVFFLIKVMTYVSVGCCNYKQQKVFIETITVLSCMYMLLYYSAWNQVCLLAYFLSSLLLCGNTGSNNAAQNGLRMRQTPRKLTKLVQLLLFFGSWPTGHKFTTVKALFCVAISK